MPEREYLGRLVRETWVAWAREQPDPKPSWLTGWDDLDDSQREVDCRIGEAVAAPYENAITWNTSRLGCAALLDSCYAETVRREQAEDLLAELRLYTNWRFVTGQLTTGQRELWADAIDTHHARLSETDPAYRQDPATPIERWWRDG